MPPGVLRWLRRFSVAEKSGSRSRAAVLGPSSTTGRPGVSDAFSVPPSSGVRQPFRLGDQRDCRRDY
jgi:hypothetical protein